MTTERAIRDAWERFVAQGDRPKSVSDAVAGSWLRSKNFEISADSKAAPVLSEAELYRCRADNALLASSARTAMLRAAEMLHDASSMLILTDGKGHIIETQGDRKTIDDGQEVNLQDGGCWREEKIGTNAIGTAIALSKPVQIHATEHFCEPVQQWTCAAAPIFHPIDRELLGVVDISGPPRTFSSQSLALVVSIASHLEGLLSQTIQQQHQRLMECFHKKNRHWSSSDMIAIDRRGGVVHASLDALRKYSDHLIRADDDLSYLRGLPFEKWPEDLSGRVRNIRTEPVTEGDEELGAIIIFPSALKNKSKTSVPNKSARKRSETVDAASASAGTLPQPAIIANQNKDSDAPELGFVASDPNVRQTCKNVASAARLNLPILICGQTGTGKEKLAQYAHASSGKKGKFIAVNCSALPESLIEAELFGYVDGAFTGARKGGAPGLIREADGGTLFLDEIGDMPISLQAVLLRFLDEFKIRPVGGVSKTVDVLLVSATNVDLGLAVTNRRFRTDLLYRLNTMQATLPSLPERSDIDEIAAFLLRKISPDIVITDDALAMLYGRHWPGNIRELRSTLMRMALAASENGNKIDKRIAMSFLGAPPPTAAKDNSLRELQRAKLRSVYEETGGNISETARRLGVCRNTVYRALDCGGN